MRYFSILLCSMLVVLSCANGTKSANGANKPITEILTDQEVVYNQENHPEVFNRLYEYAAKLREEDLPQMQLLYAGVTYGDVISIAEELLKENPSETEFQQMALERRNDKAFQFVTSSSFFRVHFLNQWYYEKQGME